MSRRVVWFVAHRLCVRDQLQTNTPSFPPITNKYPVFSPQLYLIRARSVRGCVLGYSNLAAGSERYLKVTMLRNSRPKTDPFKPVLAITVNWHIFIGILTTTLLRYLCQIPVVSCWFNRATMGGLNLLSLGQNFVFAVREQKMFFVLTQPRLPFVPWIQYVPCNCWRKKTIFNYMQTLFRLTDSRRSADTDSNKT